MADQKGNTGTENFVGWLMMIVVFICIFALFWYFEQYKVKSIIRWIRWGEMWATSWFVGDDYTIDYYGNAVRFKDWLDAIPNIPETKLDERTMDVIAALTTVPLRFIFITILAVIGLWAGMFGPGTNNRRKLDLNGLIRAQSKSFPVISPFITFNPSTQPPRPPGSPVPAELPAFAEALGPEEWLAYNEIPVPDGEVSRSAAYLAFTKQLGGRWGGWEKLPAHKQILLAAFCLKAARKRKDADDMLGRIARCWTFEKGLRLSKDSRLLKDAKKVLKNTQLSGPTLRKVNQHAFQTTALLRGLATAREEGGVMAPAEFVWLRGYDRTLWYPLNNLGRQAYHMEAIGAMDHYKAEKLTQRPIPRPKVERAVDSIIEYIKSDKARPIPQLDYSRSKKRGIKKPANTPQSKALQRA